MTTPTVGWTEVGAQKLQLEGVLPWAVLGLLIISVKAE